MKKCLLATMAIGLALLCAAPVMALDVDFSGEFRLRGVNHDNIALTDPKSASQDWFDTRARIKTTFKVNDNISFVTRFDALDNRKLGSQNENTLSPDYQNYKELDFDIAYAIVKTPYGAFLGGRMIGSQWGPSPMGDSNLKGKDRLLWYVPVGKWSGGGYWEKFSEIDPNGSSTKSDNDNDKYTAFIQHKGESFQAGLLFTHYDFREFPAPKDFLKFKYNYNNFNTLSSAATTARGTFTGSFASVQAADATGTLAPALRADSTGTLATAAAAPDLYTLENAALTAEGNATLAGQTVLGGYPNIEAKVFIVDPYVSGNFGPFSYFGELIYAWGDADYEDPIHTNIIRNNSLDAQALMYHVEGKFKFGPAAIRGGYWFMSGDNNHDDDKIESLGYIENNRDLDIALILTGNPHELGTYNTIGGVGNFSADARSLTPGTGTLTLAGGKLLYFGLGWNILENLNLDVAYINAKADKPPGLNTYNPATDANYTTEWDDDVGSEYDLTLKWTPMENLEYKIMGGYLVAGDFFKKGVATAKIDNMYTLFHALTITF